MEWTEFSGKTVEDALDHALQTLEKTSDQVEYEVIEKETSGLLGLFSKPAKIRVKVKAGLKDIAEDFLKKVCTNMGIEATFDIVCNEEEERIDINISGSEMGLLIGKRGQTLDSLQYLTSLVVNKESGSYYKVKLDTENYRERRKETLENLAKNISYKVKKTRKPVALEPMNPYERRIIHSILQNDKLVETHSEGEEPNRKVVITMKKGVRDYGNKSGGYKKYNKNNKSYRNNNYSRGGYERKNFVSQDTAETETVVENTTVEE